MATLTRGYTFGATEQVTNSKLHSLVDSGTISGIAQSDLTAGEGLVSRATTSPSDSDQLWVDTSTSPPTLKVYDGSNWVLAAEHAVMTNKTGQTTAIGQVVIIDTDNANSFEFTSTAGDSKFRGILVEAIANNSTQDVVGRGDLLVLLEVSASAGSFLRTSTATGKAEPVASTSSGIFGIVQQAGTASARSYVFGLNVAASAVAAASSAEVLTGTEASKYVAPSTMVSHQGVIKAWTRFNASGTQADNFNVASITDTGTGDWTVVIGTDFAADTFTAVASIDNGGAAIRTFVTAHAVGSVQILTFDNSGVAQDATKISVICIGDR